MPLRNDSIFKSACSICLFICVLVTLASTVKAVEVDTQYGTLTMIGIAPYEELSREYYIAALLLKDNSIDAADILSSRQQKQMQILITTDSWSPRLWQKQWLNNIAINNEPLIEGSELQEQIAFFTRLPEKGLKSGDMLVIDYQPSKGTRVVLNDRTFIETKSASLFRHLAKTWIGRLPPSREFKNKILRIDSKAHSENWISRITENTVSKSRINEVSGWYSEPRKTKKTKKDQESKTKELAQAEKKKKDEQRKIRLAQQRAKEKASKRERDKDKREKAAKKAKEKERARKRLARQKAEKERREKQLAKAQKEKEQTEEQYYYRDLFEWQVRQAIRQEVSYPEWARQFQQEGTVEVSFTLDRLGNVTNIQIQDKTLSKMLNSEVVNAIEKASKKVKAPELLQGSTWNFSVVHTFSLENTNQESLVSPILPAHLRQGKGENVSNQVVSYMKTVRDQIISEIKYPAEAIMLRKRGSAAVFVTLDSNGAVKKIFDRYNPEHEIFKTALLDAIEKAKPLPAIPTHLGRKELTVDVEYEFKR